jgi:hypothetical protein
MRGAIVVPILPLLLAACGAGGDGNMTDTANDAAAATPVADDADAREAAKLNAYVAAYNALVSTFGLTAQYAQYRGQQIEKKGIDDPVFVLPGWLDNGLTDLRKAQALPGTEATRELHAAGARLLPVLERLVGELKGLQSYYQSRGQVADNFARGRREHPQVLADFQAAITANDRLSAAIDAVQDRRDAAELEALKTSGDAIGYQGALAINRAKQLLRVTDDPAALRDPVRAARADRLVAEIVAAQAALRSALAASQGNRDPENGIRNSMYDTVADRLDGVVGGYRDYRRTGQPMFRQGMVSAYNDAIDHANMS